MELVFMPSGGVRGVAGVVSIVSGKDGELPLVILDADGSGKGAKGKLQSGLYKHNTDAIIDVGEFLDFDNGEVEDLLPPKLMTRQIGRLFRDVEDEDFEDFLVTEQAIVPQVEAFAAKYNITLPKGWKVDVARGVKQQLQKAKIDSVPDEYLKKWETLFDKFNR